MTLKKIAIALLILVGSATVTATAQVLMPSKDWNQQMSLNGLWKFKYIPSSDIGSDVNFFQPTADVRHWADIKTPGNWELQGFAEPFYGRDLKEGTGLYRTQFSVPADWKGQSVFLAFDGVQYGFRLWVNGQYVGSFASSFNRQTFEISSFVQAGKSNVLAVRVSTRPKGWEFDTNDCWSLSGIIRDVTLFGLPETHIKDLVVRTLVGKNAATLSVSAMIENNADNTRIRATLQSPDGRLVKEFSLLQKNGVFAQDLQVESPQLWTAETPYLYTLTLSLRDKKQEIQRYTQKIGIRQVTWNQGVLKLNGQPIKLRGVNHHDLSAVNGRSVTESEMLQDLKLIRQANCNFIRTSHYPPHPRFIELCDSLGFYVMEEVPFGYGDQHLNDTSYLPILKERARATVWRDKNHPSVLVWSVGNENPLTKICLQTGEYVKQLDPTRPHCFPQKGSTFAEIQKKPIPSSVEILTPHYVAPSKLLDYSNKFDRPMIVTEYAHALGLDFDKVETLWDIMYAHPKLAGGAVWHFFDQGILRTSPEKTVPGTFTTSAWLDSIHVLDNAGNQGGDGLVYANRVPQVDYWELRKVYTPVKVLNVVPGKQSVTLTLNNRFDFTNLSEIQCSWAYYADSTVLGSGKSLLVCAPHDSMKWTIPLKSFQASEASIHYIKVQFANKQGYTFYEKVYPLSRGDLRKRLATSMQKPVLKANSIVFSKYRIDLNSESGMIQLSDLSASKLIVDGPYARMGRKTTMSEQTIVDKNIPTNIDDPLLVEKVTAEKNPFWSPYLLTQPQVKVETISPNTMVVHYDYERGNVKSQFLSGRVIYSLSDSGRIDVQYHFVPKQANGLALEAGLAFLIPASLTEFRWMGQGPYPAYPGKNVLDEFGLHHLNSADLNFQGNRPEVDLAVFTDPFGNGFALLANQADIAVEYAPNGIIVSHNALISGRLNKNSLPEKLLHVEKLQEITGQFSIIPLSEQWPEVLKNLFGNPSNVAKPFVPFYNSYDQ